MSARVMPHVISAGVFPKSFARSLMVRETVKKSKASQDHARKATLSPNSQMWIVYGVVETSSPRKRAIACH